MRTIEVSDELWVDVDDGLGCSDDLLISIRDSVGGYTLVEPSELPRLIEVLQEVLKERKVKL